MTKKLRIIFGFLTIVICGCKSNEEVVKEKLKHCINSELDKIRMIHSPDIQDYKSLEITLTTFENFLLENNYLKSLDKKSYLGLIEKIAEYPNKYSEIYKHISDQEKYLDQLVLLNPPLILNQCVDHILITQKNRHDSTLNLQRIVMLSIIDSNYTNLNSINELFSITTDDDFKELIYRIPFIYIITMNAEKNDYSEKELKSQ